MNSKLMHENIALKKEIADLKKEVERLRALIPDEDPMEEDFVLTDDEEEVEEDTRPRICPLEIARVKKTLTKVWRDEQRCVALLDCDVDEDRRKRLEGSVTMPFWDITTKQLSGERKMGYPEEWQRKKYGEFYQYVPGVSQFRKEFGYSRKYHLTAKEKEESKKIMDSRRANPKILTTTADIRARAKAEGYTITKSQEKTLQHWDKSDWGFEKLMERKIIYAYEYYTKGGGMRVISVQTYSASRTRACVWNGKAEGVKGGCDNSDYCRGNIILRKKK